MRGAGEGVEGGKGIPTTNRFELLSQMEDLPVSQEGEKKNSPRAHDKGETKRSLEHGSPQGGNVATGNRFQPLSGNAAHPQGQKQKATRAQGKGKARHGGGTPPGRPEALITPVGVARKEQHRLHRPRKGGMRDLGLSCPRSALNLARMRVLSHTLGVETVV